MAETLNTQCALVKLSGRQPFNRCQSCKRKLIHCFVFKTSLISLAVIALATAMTDFSSLWFKLTLVTIIILLVYMGWEINHETDYLIDAENKTRDLLADREKILLTVKENRDYYETIFDSINEGIVVIDRDYRIRTINASARSKSGLSEVECLNRCCHQITHHSDEPCQPPNDPCPLKIVFETGRTASVSHTHYDETGDPIFVEINATPLKNAAGEVQQVVEVIRDVTDRQHAIDSLAKEKELLAVTLRSIGDGVITTDRAGKVVMINKVGELLTGWSQEEAAGMPLESLFRISDEKTGQPCESPLKQAMELGRIIELPQDTVLTARDGTERMIADSGAPIRDKESRIIGFVLVFRDITGQRELEKDAQRVQRLESLGILAGGIAHDFNNLLTAILGNISLVKLSASPDSKLHEYLVAAEKATFRSRDLTQQLLTFAKGGAPVKQMTTIFEVIEDSAHFAVRGSNVRCDVDLADDLWAVEVDQGQISQVINNLIINADQSMTEGGTIRIHGENIIIGEGALPLAAGPYLKIALTDDGCGIAPENIDKIFDPYFSTKEKGSGIGLASSYSIIKRHMGHIAVDSQAGKGSTFTIYLPASPGADISDGISVETLQSGKGKILVMDDEEMVRELVLDELKFLGYQAAVAEDGTEAIKLFRQAKAEGSPFDVVIMDLTIPGGMGGKEAVQEVLKIDPEAKVMVSSGYAQDPILSDYRRYGFSGIITKPYRIEELGQAIHWVLTNRS